MDNVPALRRKLQRVQVSNLNLTRELERAERMLKAQVSAVAYSIVDGHIPLCELCTHFDSFRSAVADFCQ